MLTHSSRSSMGWHVHLGQRWLLHALANSFPPASTECFQERPGGGAGEDSPPGGMDRCAKEAPSPQPRSAGLAQDHATCLPPSMRSLAPNNKQGPSVAGGRAAAHTGTACCGTGPQRLLTAEGGAGWQRRTV